MSLDPGELGWQEFWLRIVVIAVVLGFLLVAALIVGRLAFSVVDFVRWTARKIGGEDEGASEEPEPLQGTVYVSEYDGQPARVHASLEAAQGVCERHLKDEPGPPGPWDWVVDEYGWTMRQVSPDDGWPGAPLNGRVTRTHVEH